MTTKPCQAIGTMGGHHAAVCTHENPLHVGPHRFWVDVEALDFATETTVETSA